MGTDRPDDAELPPDEQPDRPPDQRENDARPARASGAEAEPRSREEYYVDLRIADAAQKAAAARQAASQEQVAAEKWDENKGESRWMWGEYQRKWPPEEHPKADRSNDAPGSWRSDSNKYLKPEENVAVEAACDRVAIHERDRISPAMLAVESQDPDRHLAGFDYRLKGRDRTKEKVFDISSEFSVSAAEAAAVVPDSIRFTFQYGETNYTQGVWADIGRLKEEGFELSKLKNSWSQDQYKGINSQWIEPATGQRFEVQFHTNISFEAKQLTHEAYERIRAHQLDKFEQMVLKAFQGKVSGDVPIPAGATDIPDYP